MFKKFCLGVCCIIAVAVVFVGCSESPAARIERLCGIKLPKGMEVEYNHLEETFTGLAAQYTVFQLKNEPDKFLSKYPFSTGNADAFEMRFDSHYILEKIPQEYHPDWSNAFSYREFNISSTDSATGLYFSDPLILIFIVWGH